MNGIPIVCLNLITGRKTMGINLPSQTEINGTDKKKR